MIGRLAIARLAGIVAVLAWPGPGAAAIAAPQDPADPSRILCVVAGPEAPAGLDAESLSDAFLIERQKAGLDAAPVQAARIEDCPPPSEGGTWLALRLQRGAIVQWSDGSTCALDLAGTDAPDLARYVARRVVGLMADPLLARRARLVEGDLAWTAPPANPAPPPAPPAASSVLGYLQLGGRGGWQQGPDRGSGDVEIEAGLLVMNRRLWIGGRVGYEPLRTVPGDQGSVRVQAVPVGIVGRWTFPLGPVGIRVGIGALVAWRQARLEPRDFLGSVTATSVSPAFDGDVEVTHVFGETLYLSAGLTARVYAAWADFRWFGSDAYRGPRFDVGAALRVGVLLGGKR